MDNTQKQTIIEKVTGFGAVWDKSAQSFFVYTRKRSINVMKIQSDLDKHELVLTNIIINDLGFQNLQIMTKLSD